MNGSVETPDERLNELVDAVARLTGESYVTAMCRALEERRDRLVTRRSGERPGRVLRLSLEIPEELLGREAALTPECGA
jgi:hypothetical protein